MRKLAFSAVTTAVLIAWVAAGTSPASTRSASATRFVVVATLSPNSEAAPSKASKGASGTAKVIINTKTRKACWTLKIRGLDRKDKFLSSDIHKAPKKKTGPVIIPLGYSRTGCVVVPKVAQLKAVGTKPAAYYVNVYTKKHLQGAVRGQLRAG